MTDFFGSLAATVKSLGGAVEAPLGLAKDLAMMPFDNKADNFGTVLQAVGQREAQLTDPFSNDNTWTGQTFGVAMRDLNKIYNQDVSRPISTVDTMAGHIAYDPRHIGDIMDPQKWAQAYSVAKNRSIGQSYLLEATNALGAFNTGHGIQILNGSKDPLDPTAWTQLHTSDPIVSTLMSGTSDFVARWYLDPGNVLGRGLGKFQTTVNTRYLGAFDRVGATAKMLGEAPDQLPALPRGLSHIPIFGSKIADQVGLQSRTDNWYRYISGDNKLGRPLNAYEIRAVTPELMASAKGDVIAAKVADTLDMHPEDGLRVTKNILGVAMGDPYARVALANQIGPQSAILDALDNAAKGGVLDLKALAQDPALATRPEYLAEIERQLENQDYQGNLNQFVQDFIGQQDATVREGLTTQQTFRTLNEAPAAHIRSLGPYEGGASARALSRETGTRFVRDKVVGGAEQTAEDWARSMKSDPRSALWQRGIHNVPLMIVKAGEGALSPWTKLPWAVTDALRQTHYAGIAHLHDWGGATTQLDSMLRLGGVEDGARTQFLSSAYKANTEADKIGFIQKAESLAVHALVEKHAAKFPGQEVNREFIDELMNKGFTIRGRFLTSLKGRAYAATEMPESGFTDRMRFAQDLSYLTKNNELAKWRVDQVVPDDDLAPVAVPLLETQLGNTVPLVDIQLFDRVLRRGGQFQRLSDHAAAWKQQATYADTLKNSAKFQAGAMLDRTATALKTAYQGMDWLLSGMEHLTRMWKFGVLMRLGYPMRVIMDDHLRILSQMHYGADFVAPNAAQAAKNWLYNHAVDKPWWNSEKILGGEGRLAESARHYYAAQSERSRLLSQLYGDTGARNLSETEWGNLQRAIKNGDQRTIDRLDPEGRVHSWYQQKDTIRAVNSSLKGKRGAITRWKNQLRDGSGDAATLRQKIADAEAHLADKEAALGHLNDQLLMDNPEEHWKSINELDTALAQGKKGFRPDKRGLGSQPIKMNDGTEFAGPFQGTQGEAFREATDSNPSFTNMMYGTESRMAATLGRGSYTTIQPRDLGHLDMWSDVANNQIRRSRVAMFFVNDPNRTAEDFAQWITLPSNRELRDRVATFAHDPLGWGKRVEALIRDYVPEKLRQELKHHPVSAGQLRKMFTNIDERPTIHGQAVAINTGLHAASKLGSRVVNRIMKTLGEVPTDALTRHPYFSSLYNRAVTEGYAEHKLAFPDKSMFGPNDQAAIERSARENALNHMKQTLFDVSAHSHFAHVMRFISPFFAAHQEAMSRWWNIVKEHPDVLRKFQLAFDIPATLSTKSVPLIYDVTTGEPVKPGEGISSNHYILMRIPEAFGGTSNPIDGWLKKVGGGKYWQVNQAGFNIVLQSGIFNPGIGPMVSIPTEELVQKYADKTAFVHMVRALNPYPPSTGEGLGNVVAGEVLPSAFLKLYDAMTHGQNWQYSLDRNFRELSVQFQLDHGGAYPNSVERDSLLKQAGNLASLDGWLRFASGVTAPTPAKPGDKYAAIQEGWTKIRDMMDAQGHDFQWALDTFKHKYGKAFMALVYSDSQNPAQFTGTAAEVGAFKRFNPLLKTIDPKLAKMVVGPTAAQGTSSQRAYSQDARNWLETQPIGGGGTGTYITTKTPVQTVEGLMISDGWQKYSQLTSALTVLAQQRGESDYTNDPQLMAAKQTALQTLAKQNDAWYGDYMQHADSPFQNYLTDMQKIVNYKPLWKDPTRVGDVSSLKTYLQARTAIDSMLQDRSLGGGSASITAKSNSDLAGALAAVVTNLRDKSTYFDDYYYNGIIEFDPYLKAARADSVAAGTVAP